MLLELELMALISISRLYAHVVVFCTEHACQLGRLL